MKLAVVGSRNFSDRDIVESYLETRIAKGDITLIISGGARGVDKWAEIWASENDIPTKIFLPDWGGLRNSDIVAEADEILVFWDGKSRGTKDVMNKARAEGVSFVLHRTFDYKGKTWLATQEID